MEEIVPVNVDINSEDIFLRVILEKFEPMLEANSPSMTQRIVSKLSSNKNSFFCCQEENPESTQSLPKKKSKSNLSYYSLFAMSTVMLVSVYSSWMYKDSSEEASLIIRQQLNNLTQEWQNNTSVSLQWLTYGIDAITWLIYSCAMPTFTMMAMKINALLANQAKYFMTRSDDEIELMGKLNPAFVISSLIVGGCSELPLVKVAWDSAKTMPSKINNLFAGVL